MSDFKVVSRKDLVGDEIIPENDNEDVQDTPSIDLQFIEVKDGEQLSSENKEQVDEFEFPLFSFGSFEPANTSENPNGGDNVSDGKSQVKLMKVSLRDLPNEVPKQERPRSYYFPQFNAEDLKRFKRSAVDYDTVMEDSRLGPNRGWPQFRGGVLDIDKHNHNVEAVLAREKILHKRRPGKKQRIAKRVGTEREKERITQAKEIKKLLKKKFHKRGGKKNKKVSTNPLEKAGGAPKFRTE